MSVLFFLFLFFRGCFLQSATDNLIVHTKVGSIKGIKATDGDYNMFTGIPYGKVNASNPFGLSSPHPPFEEVFNADQDPVMCIQTSQLFNPELFVDCLQLNVYVPTSASPANPLPVLVYIHGGGFTVGWSGKANHGPQFLIKHDVIMVSINYRLGVYGFMCLDIPEVPGNQGLRDQLMAIKWVKENIFAFGGDADKITIMGESAGAASVDYLLRFSEPNIFDKAILLSGSANSPWALIIPDYQFAINLAKNLGFTTNDTYEAVDFLATADPKLVMLQSGNNFGPCVEKEFDSIENFVTDDPTLTKIPNVKNTPILIGYNDAEMGFVVPFPIVYSESFFLEAAKELGFEGDDAIEIGDMFRRFFVGDIPKELISEEELLQFIYFYSDTYFIHAAERAIENFIQNGATNIFRYLFTYTGDRNYFRVAMNSTLNGVVHGDSLGYIFDMSFLSEPINEQDQLMIDRKTTTLTNFVKYGDPTPQTSQLLPLKWPQITPEASYFITFDKDLTVGTRPNRDRMAFWDLVHELSKNKDNNIFRESEIYKMFVKILERRK